MIKVKSIEFGNPSLRKLRNIKINFADRLTIIAGHNGIGKTTILGLVANTFGLTATGAPSSYFKEKFYANIERTVYLALYEETKSKESPETQPIVVAEVDGVIVRKRCAMTHRSEWKRARVVPRTIDKAKDDGVGQDAKIPLPTIYLGIKRLASIGEAEEKDVSITELTDMNNEDASLIKNFYESVILGSQVTSEITQQDIKGSKKQTTQPGHANHDAMAISLGQDSLGSIATALASFNRLKRELGDSYPGGLLVIDELDVGFHPHAIKRLVLKLKMHAKQLDLQVIATTHSPTLIEAVHPDGGGNVNAPDAVVYLLDTRNPRLAENQKLSAILDEMALPEDDSNSVKPTKPLLCFYFEDSEGKQFCEELIPSAKRAAIGKKYGVRIKLIALGVGGSNLIKLPEMDPIFKDRGLVVDADTTIPAKAAKRGNTIKLPCANGASGTDRSPENTIKKFLRGLATASDGPLHDALLRLSISNPSSDRVNAAFFPDDTGNSNNRDSSKIWWVSHWNKLERWGVIREWAVCHQSETDIFVTAFENVVAHIAKRPK